MLMKRNVWVFMEKKVNGVGHTVHYLPSSGWLVMPQGEHSFHSATVFISELEIF